jgi:tetratricopeptide (TPR) repeat protein
MLDVLEANELLERAEELRRTRNYAELRKLVATIPRRMVQSNPDFGYISAFSAYRSGNLVIALARIDRALSLLATYERSRLQRRLINLKGIVLVDLGRLDEAVQQFMLASSFSAEVCDTEMLANTVMNLGVIADIRCRWDEAIAQFSRARLAFEALGNQRLAAGSHHNLGMSFRQKGQLRSALRHLDLALDGHMLHGTSEDIVAAQAERALVVFLAGDGSAAIRSAELAVTSASTLNNPALLAECRRVLGTLLLRNSEDASAGSELELALGLARDSHAVLLQAEILEELAVLKAGQNKRRSGDQFLSRSVRLYSRLGSVPRSERARMRYEAVFGGGST